MNPFTKVPSTSPLEKCTRDGQELSNFTVQGHVTQGGESLWFMSKLDSRRVWVHMQTIILVYTNLKLNKK